MTETAQSKSKKIVILFLLILFALAVFTVVMAGKAVGKRHTPRLYTSSSVKAMRGSILSADGFHIATTRKLYKATVDTRSIDPGKKELFVQLFSIYSGISVPKVRKRLAEKRGSIVLSYNISPKRAQYLKSLAFELRRLGVFVEYETAPGRTILRGLNVVESGEARIYPYGDLLTPLIGYPRKFEKEGYTRNRGIKGLEKQFDDSLQARRDGYAYAPRDVNNYKRLTKESLYTPTLDGYNLQLTIPVTLQIRVEKITDAMKAYLGADEIMAVIMDSRTGEILSLASSNRFNPTHIRKSDYSALNTGALEYSFEPGSVLKPLVFSILLEHGKVNPYDIVNGHGGRFRMGRKVITDEHKFNWLSAENVIVHSSNIGMAQLAQKLDGAEFAEGLRNFGLTKPTGMHLPYEKPGVIPSVRQLNAEIYKATTSYGYGLQVNLMQLVKAYNVFNNGGKAVTPTAVKQWIDPVTGETLPIEKAQDRQILSPATAARMKQILIKTVMEGTGTGTITPGVEIGGKTGTAHIAEGGRYVRQYNTSFLGFANDAKGHHYTIGVTVIKPKKYHFASLTAVAVYKKIIDMMVREGYLVPAQPEPAEGGK
jgi:cell division protein FtsI (penicillin-binding protein 3)